MMDFIKSIVSITFLIAFSVSSSYSIGDCLSQYKCKLDINGTQIMGIKNCTLPNMNTFPISAPNVLNADGTLKTYFKTKNTVCDVLGWMNGAVPSIAIKLSIYFVVHWESGYS